jgi:hypothetical protein
MRSPNELYCDERIGGVKRWVVGNPADMNMRIDDTNMKTVCFICVKVSTNVGEQDFFIGTGFFVGVASTLPGLSHSYLVTARHVIEDAKAQGYSEFYVRLNMQDGTSATAAIPSAWIYPDNPAVDIALVPVSFSRAQPEYLKLPSTNFVTQDVIAEHSIGVGDDLFMVGLFSQRWGYHRNIPIVRTGIIAAMPDEPFPTQEGGLYDGYLVETRSIGGLSGSPVFVRIDAWRPRYQDKIQKFDTSNLRWQTYLLGVVRGHWDLERQDAAVDTSLPATLENTEIERLNTGIAVVTPIQEVHKILQEEELMKNREGGVKKLVASREPTADSRMPKKNPNELSFTRSDFQDVLKKVSKKTSEPESKSEGKRKR